MTTRGKLIEQAKRIIKGGDPSIGSNIISEEIGEYVGQVLNELLKTEYFGTTLPTGETVPAGCVLATYDGITVESYKGVSRSKLPAFPVLLPRNIGLFHVGSSKDILDFYIPVLPGEMRLMKSQVALSELDRPCYEMQQGYIIFDRDLTGGEDCTIMVQMVVMDMGSYSEYDPLPIPPNMEKTVVDAVVARFMGEPRPDKQVDSGAEPTKIQQSQTRRR